jgi:threonine aldolase
LKRPDEMAVVTSARAQGVLLSPFGARRVRAVTHMDVDDAGIGRAVEVVRGVV